jgi:hypothetical protein
MPISPRYSIFLIAVFSLGCLFFDVPSWAASQEPLLINQIAIDPQNPNVVYAAARPQGVLKSLDRGESWRPARNGLTNTSAYYLVINPKNSRILYLGTFGGGIYKSENGGENWFEVNHGLGNTNIHALAFNPLNPDQLIVSTSTGELFKSDDAAKTWNPFNDGLPFFPGDIIATLLVFPKDPGGYYLAQGGLFLRPFSSATWKTAEGNLQNEVMTAFVYDTSSRTYYAGTMKAGLFKTSMKPEAREGHSNPIPSRFNWKPIQGPYKGQWIRLIALDPANSSTIYVAVADRGLFRSSDRGSSWEAINSGLPTKEVESLAIDPENPKTLYAGTHNDGLFVSRDGGKTWNPPQKLEVEPVKQIIASLMSPPSSEATKVPQDAPPPSFAKCNKCHGWADTALNQKSTYWRVSPNHRDWEPTVRRMSPGAGLTPEEQKAVIQFLTAYSRHRSEEPKP